MRYTEARMTEVARLLLDGIDEDAVDFRPTYDGGLKSQRYCPQVFQIFWPMGHRVSLWVWLPQFLHIIYVN